MRNLEILEESQKKRLAYLENSLTESTSDFMKNYTAGCISELKLQMGLLDMVMQQEVIDAQ